MSDERQLVNVLESQIAESETSGYEVGEQRERNHRYYTLSPIGNEIEGRSHYISPDVLDSVEAKKALFSETFFSGRRIVKFKPTGPNDKQEADKRTAYVNLQLERNNIFDIFRDGWHDAFVAKRMSLIVDWDELSDDVVINFKGATPQQIQQVVMEQGEVVGVDDSQMQPDMAQPQMPQQGMQGQPQQPEATFSGPLTVSLDNSHVKLYLAQPERIFRDPNATYIKDCQYYAYEEDLSRGDLVRRGFDPEQAESLTVDYRFRSEEEDNSRKAHDRSWTRRQQHNRPDNQELITTYRTWSWLDMSEYGEDDEEHEGMGLYEIFWAHGEVLNRADGTRAIKKVTEIPAFEWTEFKISHAENGMADADLVAHTQKTLSTLKRLIIDNQQMRNTSRYEAVQGSIKNPRELLDNSIGGVIWSRAIGSVQPLSTPELSPATMAVVEMLDQDKEERSGVSRLSKGMNNDALRYQNSADMVERLTNASQMRVMRAARDFAESFFVPVCQYIYRLGVRNDKRTHEVEVAGKYETITPSAWPDMDMTMNVSVALTPDQGRQQASTMLQMFQLISQDPSLQLGFGYEQKWALLDDAFDNMGIADTSQYLLRPDSPEYQQKQQFQAQKMKEQQQSQAQQAQFKQLVQQKQLEMKMSEQEFKQWVGKDKAGREWFTAQLKDFESKMKTVNMLADNKLQRDEHDWDKVIDIAELELERQQKRQVGIS